jgi:hypothetical protein
MDQNIDPEISDDAEQNENIKQKIKIVTSASMVSWVLS